ncbi:MAG TPA: arylamine N-acetyltransferase [Myxococcota bacterium]|jgi:N-hydroxyarylamine O-acetyltransferase
MLDAYLARIDYDGPVRRDLATLSALHRAHVTSIPYDTLEIQLGRGKALAEDAFFEALVRRRRGGWCYEMNGLLTRVLRDLGFAVTRVAGAVARESLGDGAEGNHLVGLVDLDRRWVVDVGLMDGPLDPFPLEVRSWREGPLEFRLERLQDGWWRFHNHAHGLARSFDFTEEPRDLTWYGEMCTALQTQDFSPFVQYAFASLRAENGFRALRDATYFDLANGEMRKREVADARDYRALLADILGVDLGDEADALWRRIHERVIERARSALSADVT